MAYCPLLFPVAWLCFALVFFFSEFDWILGDFFLKGMTELHLFLLPRELLLFAGGRTMLCGILSSKNSFALCGFPGVTQD